MGTRGAIGFKVCGKYKITYNHFDSYPDGLGEEVVKFVEDVRSKGDIGKFRKNAEKVRLVTDDTPPTQEDIEKYEKLGLLNENVSNQTKKEWYCLLREAQGANTLELVRGGKLGHMIDNFKFLEDSLFCEYAYIVNLDDNRLEFYEGFNTAGIDKDSPLPFKDESKYEAERGGGSRYFPVRFKGSVPLDKPIPKDWQERFYPHKDEDE